MIGLFKQKSPVNIVLLLIMGLLIKMPLFLYPRQARISQTDGILYRAIASVSLKQNNALAASLIAFALLYIQALLLNYLVNEYKLTIRPSYLPAMAYLLITSLLPDWNYLSAPLITNTLIIWSFVQLFKTYNIASAKDTIYNIGLTTGLCSLIFFPSALITVSMLLGVMILRPFRLNELILLLIGVLTPYYFYAAYLFLNDRLTLQALFPVIHIQVPVIKNSIWLSINVALLAIPFLTGGYYIQTHLHKMLIQVRKNWSILLLYLLLTLFFPFVSTSAGYYNWILVAVPFAAFHACAYLYLQRKWLSLALFFIMLTAILVQQYGTALWR